MFSTNYYDIDEISIGTGEGKDPVSTSISFKADTSSQIEARKMLEKIAGILKENKMTEFNGLIKHTAYTLPDNLKSLIEDKSTNINSTNVTHRPANTHSSAQTPGYTGGHRPYVNNNTTWKRKEVTTTTIKRTTRYDIAAAMAAVDEKFAALKADGYIPPKLPRIPGDKMAENGADDANTDAYDDYSKYGYP